MVHYSISRLLLTVQSTSSPTTMTTTTTTPEPEYSEVVIILTCLLCALICAVGVLGVVRWSCLKQPASSSMPSTNDDVENPSELFKKKIVESLPKLIFKSSMPETTTPTPAPAPAPLACEAECVICLSEFHDGEEIRVLPGCTHVFHVGCIDTWLIGSNSFCCPSCRRALIINQWNKCGSDVRDRVSLPLSTPQVEADYLP